MPRDILAHELYVVDMPMKRLAILALFTLGLQAQVTMVVQTNPKPNWGPTQTWRTGAANGLDGTASTGNTGYTWSCTAYDPGTGSTICPLSFSSTTASKPTVTGVVAGDYSIHLCDGAGMNCVTTHVGAVDFDAATGIVKTHNTTADKVFGPMLAIGQNPWNLEDERSTTMMGLQWTLLNTTQPYNSYSDYNPSWANDQTGTVSWTWNGKNSTQIGGAACTTLNTSITATSTSIIVTDATCLDLSSLPSVPTAITLQANVNSAVQEQIRICSTTGTTGMQTLGVCYDGRGPVASGSYYVAAQSWSSGAVVGQSLVKGSGTSFLSTICPGGAGLAGPVPYSTGTVTVTAGSPTITGTSTNWTTGNGVVAGYAIQVYGTTGGGATNFTFIALINTVGSTTSITASRNYPSTADNGTFSYKVIIPFYRWIVSHYTRGTPYSGDALIDWGTTTCEDDTHSFVSFVGVIGHDQASLNGQTFTGENYAYMDNANSNYPDTWGFYCPACAFRAMWYRAGIVQYLQMANTVSKFYPRFPGFGDGGVGGYGDILYVGSGIIDSTVSYILNGTPAVTDLRPSWNAPTFDSNPASCNLTDTRSQSYGEGLVFLGALYDPDTSYWQPLFRSRMATINAWDNMCAGSGGGVHTNSFENQLYWNADYSQVTLTNGSTAGTGTGLPSSVCSGADSGTVTVTAGSAAVTATSGTFTSGVNAIVIQGRYFMFSRTGSTTGNLAALWPGSSGSYSYMTVNYNEVAATSIMAFGNSNDDPALANEYVCTWNSATSITLDRNFSGNSNTYYEFQTNTGSEAAGLTQQPFMMGIKAWVTNQAAPLDSTLSLNNGTIRGNVATWVATYGYDNQSALNGTQAIYWARNCTFCESGGANTGSFDYTTPIMRAGFAGSPNYTVQEQREINQEGFNGLVQWYISNANSTNKAIVDYLYGALWGSTSLDNSSVSAFTDSYSVGNVPGYLNLSNGYLAAGKYPGFFFGMGMAHVWPALRQCQVVGGVVPVVSGVVQCLASASTNGGTVTSGTVTISGGAQVQ